MFRQEIDLGLGRVLKLLESLGSPHFLLASKVIHVAGTNGKGSTCGFLGSILIEAGYTVGRFTSPHLVEPRDCIFLNQEAISVHEWNDLNNEVQAHSIRISANETSFERLTCVALLCFMKHQVDFAVVEVGLGGKLDATNVFPHRLLTVMTPISEDHQNFFGDTVSKIAVAECEILSNDDCIVAVQSKDANEKVRDRALRTGGKFEFVTAPLVLDEETNHCEIHRGSDAIRVHVPLLGAFQRINASTAVWAALRLKEKGLQQLTSEVIARGVAATKWPGRLEWVSLPTGHHQQKKLLIDGAHNKSGAHELRLFIDNQLTKSGRTRTHFIFGAAAHKDLRAILGELLRPGDALCAVPFSTPEGMAWIKCQSSEQILTAVQQHFPEVTTSHASSWRSAWESIAEKEHLHALVVLTGSLYLMSEFYRTRD